MVPRLYAEKIVATVYGRENPILSEVTFSIYEKEFVVVLGHNGSGKSTLVKILSGVMKPTYGRVCINGLPIDDISDAEAAIDIVTLTQRPEDRLFVDMTLRENIVLWESRFPAEQRLEAQEMIALTNGPKRFMERLDQPINTLSGGEKQALLLALVLAHPPKILFLDEHTSSLDPKASKEVMARTAEAIKDHKITALMVTHNLEDAVQYGDRIIVLNEGRIVVDQKKTGQLSIEDLTEMME